MTSKKFVAPTVDEVRAYCLERTNNVDPERFVDHYASKGWKVGKASMKDWKAAVRTWEKNDFSSNGKTEPINGHAKSEQTTPRILTKVEINARNREGMTAEQRAAYDRRADFIAGLASL